MSEIWHTIESTSVLNVERETAIMEVPGGVIVRYRMLAGAYAGYNINTSMVFVPGAKLTDFKPIEYSAKFPKE